MSDTRRGRLAPAIVLVLLIALIGGGVLAWWVMKPKDGNQKEDLEAASAANARGLGEMLRFDYAKAVEAFEEAARQAPNWAPAKINLGIALLNYGGIRGEMKTQLHDRALALFREVIEKDAVNPYAHYCTGLILRDSGKTGEALAHFEAATRIDPNDAYSWLLRGDCIPDSSESPRALEYFEKALKLDPFLNVARYKVMQHATLLENPKRKDQLLKEWDALEKGGAIDRFSSVYTEAGKYAECIGLSPAVAPVLGAMPMFEPARGFTVALAPGTVWAGADKLDELRKAVRGRFGGAVILLDYNRDGKPDILLLSAVIRGGEVKDLLLRNDGGNKFSDVTTEAGLDKHPGSLGGAAADYDNDGFVDLALAGPTGVRLFRNVGGKAFEDKTAAAGFDKEPGVFFTASWLDLEQDGDLDLVVAKYAATPKLALKQLRGEKVDGNGRLCVFVNVGEAPPGPKAEATPPLKTAFKLATAPEALMMKGPVVGFAATDLDGFKDIDLILLIDGQPPHSILNERMFRFRRGADLIPESAAWTGGLSLAANGDDQPDYVLLDPAHPPRIRVSKAEDPSLDLTNRFGAGHSNSPPLRQAAWVDLDLDGRTDLLGVSADGKPVFLQGQGDGNFTLKALAFADETIPELLAVLPVAVDGGQNRDVLCWSGSAGLKLFHNLGNGNHALRVTLSGIRDPGHAHPLRSNADGIGAWVRIHAGSLSTAAENTTQFAGLGQSRLPLHFGIGKAESVDALCMRWPDAMPQAEVSIRSGSVAVLETFRKPESCPTIFAWDGQRFAFVTDCLGAGSMGELSSDGGARPPRPEESVKLEPGQLAPKDGRYVLKVADPMDEVMYLDYLRLDVIDHPAGTSTFPDERFATAGPQPSQERLFFRDGDRIFPVKAIDHHGRDVTSILRERDGKMVDDFAMRSWLGFAEEHWVELDFGDRLRSLPSGRKAYLVLAGWTDYPYPESIFAAEQAGVPVMWPMFEQKQADGKWKSLGEIGLPAGLPRVMTVDVTNLIDRAGGPVRIRTNTQIYWDQIFVSPVDNVGATVRELPVARASLEYRGFVQELSTGPHLPVSYNYDRLEPVLYTKWRGRLTRTGDVTELLARDDDHFAICGPGDEITAEFEALPPPPAGWQRSFVLRTRGYCKDTALATATNSRVEPLPHRGMTAYPYDPAREALPAHVVEYDRAWNTRSAGKR